MGGEQALGVVTEGIAIGLSPRGRGTGRFRRPGCPARRFIPAWAGNSLPRSDIPLRIPVHPRVGGEQVIRGNMGNPLNGSSPRGRGTVPPARAAPGPVRFIPAWAGNRFLPSRCWYQRSVHPRVGGEQVRALVNGDISSGSSPRGRGTAGVTTGADRPRRFIPAWAGNRAALRAVTGLAAVHPRVGGEQCAGGAVNRRDSGSSPRGRGTVLHNCPCATLRRFIPAWAGNSGAEWQQFFTVAVHPRVGGEQAFRNAALRQFSGSSPRGRGTVSGTMTPIENPRFIPAWAGISISSSTLSCSITVHPRVGGEQLFRAIERHLADGSSPRGRGTGP